MGAALELFRASEMIIHPDDMVLEKQNSWASDFLKQGISNSSIHGDRLDIYITQEVVSCQIFKHYSSKNHIRLSVFQVEHALRFPYHANLDRIANRKNIEHYNVDSTRILKTAYRYVAGRLCCY